MDTIIIATDFSASATNAVNYAADMAKAFKAKLILFHAYSIPVTYNEVPAVVISLEELKTESELTLQTVKESLAHVHNTLWIETICKLGNTIDELSNTCAAIQPLAVVVGTKEKSAIEQLTLGSTALTAIKHLPYPVLCVPIGKTFNSGFKKIGFACDFKKIENKTPIEELKKLAAASHAELHVLNIDYDNKHFRPDTPEQSFLLHEMLKDLRPVYHFITSKNIEKGITEFAEANNLDLLIAIPKKHKLLDAIFKPSTTKSLVLHSHIPVLCLPE